ncbi:M15 family metallopeptidase [Flavobacterium sp. K5-23]|uniref:M15 family metallopeptidase n=1 Tax=Flavobacterium sp. K5-23 TaxID=2746225 RepID=UPI00200D7E88|nr:M15 family metallopeptidase [Flavobacterium sp. K5-23]UQD57285.1 M15 family metallopeptidase [Flavobacterium sp. K5-23]
MRNHFKPFLVFVSFIVCFSCKAQVPLVSLIENTNHTVVSDTTFVNLKDYSADFVYDMKYATTDNFLNAKVYDCAECYLRLKTVNALIEANKNFMDKGYKIKLYDCYRPLDIQKKMWNIVPNPEYVANPSKGSIHNRGGAVDITLVDREGKELDMGTPFDFFGIEASHGYLNLTEEVKKNRILLKNIMKRYDFNSFDSEWWHYNLQSALKDKVSNAKWDCD